MATEVKDWLPYFNPCGGQVAEGWTTRRCFEACDKGKMDCLPAKAFQMATYMLNGTNSLEQEQREFESYFKTKIGKKMVQMDGSVESLTDENFPNMIETTVERAVDILDTVSLCAERTIPAPGYRERCTDSQREILDQFGQLNNEARGGFGTREAAAQYIADMQELLKRALEQDMDELGLITRQAISYGLGEEALVKRGINSNLIATSVGDLERS